MPDLILDSTGLPSYSLPAAGTSVYGDAPPLGYAWTAAARLEPGYPYVFTVIAPRITAVDTVRSALTTRGWRVRGMTQVDPAAATELLSALPMAVLPNIWKINAEWTADPMTGVILPPIEGMAYGPVQVLLPVSGPPAPPGSLPPLRGVRPAEPPDDRQTNWGLVLAGGGVIALALWGVLHLTSRGIRR